MAFKLLLIFLLSCFVLADDNSFQDIIVKLKQKFESLNDYKCEFAAYSSDGKRQELVNYRYFYKKPNLMRSEPLDGKNKGAILLYKDGKVRVKPGSKMFSRFTFTFDPNDRKVCDLRGHGLDHSYWGWFIDQHIKAIDWIDIISSREEILDDKKTIMYDLTSIDKVKAPIYRENIWVDTENLVIIKYVIYDRSGNIIQSSHYMNIVLNSSLDDSIFTDFNQHN